MTTNPSRILRLFTTSALLTVGLGALGTACLSRPIEPLDTRTTFTTQSLLPRSNIDKIDILFVIDDSGSMGDKQSVLAQAVPDLITTLANPPCTATDGSYVSSPADPLSDCPKGSHRDFKAIDDIHLAVISTDLGARGGTGSCDKDGLGAGAKPLVGTPDDGTLPSVDGKGFLAWDPAGAASGDGRYDDIQALAKDVEKIVRGVGQAGCGLEAPLESWYRFLVDPKPFTTVSVDKDNYRASVAGDDTELKAQREALVTSPIRRTARESFFAPAPNARSTSTTPAARPVANRWNTATLIPSAKAPNRPSIKNLISAASTKSGALAWICSTRCPVTSTH
jgi:hypothetical protein